MASLIVGGPPTAAVSSSRNVCSPRLSSSRSEILGVSLSFSASPFPRSASLSNSIPFVHCGRGDKKTAKGKRFNHSFGNARPRNRKKGRGPARVPVPSSPPRKDKFEDDEKIKIEIDESLFSDKNYWTAIVEELIPREVPTIERNKNEKKPSMNMIQEPRPRKPPSHIKPKPPPPPPSSEEPKQVAKAVVGCGL